MTDEVADDVAAGETPATPLEVLRSRTFGPYFLGNSLSNIGTWFQNLAAALLVFELTRSSLLVGLVNFAQFAGTFVLAPAAGSAADRFDRRKLLIVTQVGAAVVSAVLALLTALGLVNAAVVIGAAGLLGLSLAFMVPALLAMVPLLVERRDLDTAVSLNSVTFNLARAVGPVLAAVVVSRFGYAPAFAVNAVSFGVFALVLVWIRPRAQERVVGARPRLIDSIRAVREIPLVGTLLLLVMALSMSTDPVNTLTPEFAQDVLGGGKTLTGLLIGAFGGGATVGAVTVLPWLRRQTHPLAVSLAVQAGGMLVFALAPTAAVALTGMAVSGVGFIGGITRATARVQLVVPDSDLGRVMALWSLAFIGTRPVAALIDGGIAELVSPRVAAAVMALPALAGAIVAVRTPDPYAGQSAGGGSSVAT
jgi:MFS family permease